MNYEHDLLMVKRTAEGCMIVFSHHMDDILSIVDDGWKVGNELHLKTVKYGAICGTIIGRIMKCANDG